MERFEILQRTRTYIADNFLYTRPDLHVDPSDSLLDSGILDSMGIMELVAFLQEEFGIPVEDDEITEENLDSLNAIVEFVARKQAVTLPIASALAN
jgi:acyl carrier protein